jgi:acetolactate synthase I/II/III large subunit
MDAAASGGESCNRRKRSFSRVTKASDLLVAALENEGVEYIFAIPGEENLDVLDSLRRSKIKLVLTRHEQAAGFMAATYGRLTGRAGVCLTTLGPGALNLTTAAAYAHLGAMPMVMITGQKAIRSSRQARFQIVDIVATMRPLTKMATQIVAAQSIPTLVRDAFRVAQQERPGPVHLELPEDIAADEAAADMIPPHAVELPVAPGAAIDRAAAMIMAAQRPLVMLGAAASRAAMRDSVLQHPDGKGRGQCRLQSLYRHGRAVGAGLGSRGDRQGRSDYFDRP